MPLKQLTLLSLSFVISFSLIKAEKVRLDTMSIMKTIVDKLPEGGVYHFDHVEARVKNADGEVEVQYLDGMYDKETGVYQEEKFRLEKIEETAHEVPIQGFLIEGL